MKGGHDFGCELLARLRRSPCLEPSLLAPPSQEEQRMFSLHAAISIPSSIVAVRTPLASALGRKHRPSSFGIGVPITPVHRLAKTDMNALHRAPACLDVAVPARPDSYSSDRDTRLRRRGRHHGTHQVPRSETAHHTRRFGRPVRETGSIHLAHLSAMPSHRRDHEWSHILPAQARGGGLAHTGSIQPMRLRDATLLSIPLRQPTSTPSPAAARTPATARRAPSGSRSPLRHP